MAAEIVFSKIVESEITLQTCFACVDLAEQCQPDAFANWTTPKWAFIAGANTDGLISTPIYEAHGATVLNTAQCGAITTTVDPAGLHVECFRPMLLTAGRAKIDLSIAPPQRGLSHRIVS